MSIVLDSKKNDPKNVGKKSIVKDENGYYKIFLGKLNSYNSSGIFYRVMDMRELLTGNNSTISKRIKEGLVKGEQDHPDFRGMDQTELINRIFHIDMDNYSHHIKSIEFINTNKYEKGWEKYPIHEVWGWVKPSGPKGKYLQEDLDNPDMNVAFSIRSAVHEDRVGAMVVRTVLDISTWDWVHENGVKNATQWFGAGLEKSSYDGTGTLCLNGSCATKLREMIPGNESKDYLKDLADKLDKQTNKVFRW